MTASTEKVETDGEVLEASPRATSIADASSIATADAKEKRMDGLITFLVGAFIAGLAIGAWAVARWRAARAAGGRRW